MSKFYVHFTSIVSRYDHLEKVIESWLYNIELVASITPLITKTSLYALRSFESYLGSFTGNCCAV